MQESTNNLLANKFVHLLAFHIVAIYLTISTLTATPTLHFSAFLFLHFLLTSCSLVTMLTRKSFKSRQTCHLTSYNGNEDPNRFFGRSFLMSIQKIKVLKKVIKIPWSETCHCC